MVAVLFFQIRRMEAFDVVLSFWFYLPFVDLFLFLRCKYVWAAGVLNCN